MKNKKKLAIALLMVGLFFVLINLLITPNFGDDIKFQNTLSKHELLPWLLGRYDRWSSRFLLEAIMALSLKVPVILWKIFNVSIVCALFIILEKLSRNMIKPQNIIFVALLLCCYPFMHMGSAGWITTITNYLWPLTSGLFALIGLKKVVTGERISPYEYVFYIPALIYACNNEQISVTCFCLFAVTLLLQIKKKKVALYTIIGAMISLGSIIFILSCPGNSLRLKVEITKWMPEFPNLSFFDKIRIGLVSTLQHFVSIPDVLFFLLSLLVFIGVAYYTTSLKRRIVGAIPLIIDIALTGYYIIRYIFIQRDINYASTDILLKNKYIALNQGLHLALLALYVICVLISLYWIFQGTKTFLLITIILMVGFASRMMMCLSPTMLASGTRTFFVLYFAIMTTVLLLIDKLEDKAKWIRRCIYGIAIIGMVINVGMVIIMDKMY